MRLSIRPALLAATVASVRSAHTSSWPLRILAAQRRCAARARILYEAGVKHIQRPRIRSGESIRSSRRTSSFRPLACSTTSRRRIERRAPPFCASAANCLTELPTRAPRTHRIGRERVESDVIADGGPRARPRYPHHIRKKHETQPAWKEVPPPPVQRHPASARPRARRLPLMESARWRRGRS
jgi:hypothetical protein